MFYVRTTGGSMMAITPRATASVTVKKDSSVVKNASNQKPLNKKKT